MSTDVASLQAEVKRLESELQALNVGGEQITISEYLLKRLEQLGVKVNSRCRPYLVIFLMATF